MGADVDPDGFLTLVQSIKPDSTFYIVAAWKGANFIHSRTLITLSWIRIPDYFILIIIFRFSWLFTMRDQRVLNTRELSWNNLQRLQMRHTPYSTEVVSVKFSWMFRMIHKWLQLVIIHWKRRDVLDDILRNKIGAHPLSFMSRGATTSSLRNTGILLVV